MCFSDENKGKIITFILSASVGCVSVTFGELVVSMCRVSWALSRVCSLSRYRRSERRGSRESPRTLPAAVPKCMLTVPVSVSARTHQPPLSAEVCSFLSPQGSLILFYHARIELLKGNVEKVVIVARLSGAVSVWGMASHVIQHKSLCLCGLEK